MYFAALGISDILNNNGHDSEKLQSFAIKQSI